jgi:hypothetical protein
LNVGATAQSTWFTGLQLEQGPVATPFTTASGTLQGELALAMRYYQRLAASSGSTYASMFPLAQKTSTNAYGHYVFPVPMRTNPSLNISGAVKQLIQGNTISAYAFDQFTTNNSGTVAANILFTVNGSVPYADQLVASNSASVYVEMSAEL